MNITKEQADKVIAALDGITKHFGISRLHESTLADSTVRGNAHEAAKIMRGLSEDAEPVNRCITELLAFAKDHPGTYIFPSWDGSRVMKYLATSPQAAQTDEREAFEALYEGDALECGLEHSNWFRRDPDGDYELHNVSTAWEYFRKGRAGRKG